ncbi:hypothetical protein ACFXPJ_39895, partial [Streptomyces goshikiensis]
PPPRHTARLPPERRRSDRHTEHGGIRHPRPGRVGNRLLAAPATTAGPAPLDEIRASRTVRALSRLGLDHGAVPLTPAGSAYV